MKVLVTGAGALLGQGLIKSLRLAKTGYHIIAADPYPQAVGLYWADSAYLIPLASAPDYLEKLRQILRKERPDIVLIGTDVELLVFALNKAMLESEFNTHIIVSSPEVIRIADDKWLTYEFLKSHGFPYPRSALPDGEDDLLRDCGFPLIVKPRIGARSVGVNLVDNDEELRIALKIVHNPIIQECVATSSDEYTCGIMLADGCVKAAVTMRRELRDGNTYRAYVEPNAPFEKSLVEIATKLGGFGPLNFQFRVAQNLPKIFEINARFSGTTPLRAYAGFNEVDALIRKVVLGESISAPQLKPLTILRYWNEIVLEGGQISTLAANGTLDSPSYIQGSSL